MLSENPKAMAHISARRDGEHDDLVVMQRSRVLDHGTAMLLLNIPPPQNMEPWDHNPMPVTLYTRGTQEEEHVRTTPEFTLQNNRRYKNNWGAWLAVVSAYLGMLALLVSYNQLKFEKETKSPFQTHLGFIAMSIVALFMVLITSGIAVYTNNNLQSLMKEYHYYYPVFEVVLKSLFCFNAILAPLSLLLLLFIPTLYTSLGYLIVSAIFGATIVVGFKSLKNLRAAKRANNFGGFQMV